MDQVSNYLRRGLPQVSGWLHPLSARCIASLSQLQREEQLPGAVGEIGVHHGKLFLVLHTTADPGTPSFAVDVFGEQSLNVDRSGRGDLQVFQQNLARWGGGGEVKILQASSLTLDVDGLRATTGAVRLFSIDGGHTAECTLNDLQLADGVIAPHGVVIVDDFFNQQWPDVSTGVAHYMLSPGARLKPFAITPNKVFLCLPEFAQFYRSKAKDRWRDDFAKSSEMFGSPVHIFGARKRRSRIVKLRRAVGRTALGRRLKAAIRR